MRVIALVDGEHYPSVTMWGIASARAAGFDVLAALLVGGVEKLGPGGRLDLGRTRVLSGAEPASVLADAIEELSPEAILDLGDEPVLAGERRMLLVAVALVRGMPYIGPDFRFDPPIREAPLPVPTLAVIGTGKRTGKTAVSGQMARLTAAAGLRPVIVAMGRGGPAAPTSASAAEVDLDSLLDRVDRGEHAASDFLEDAMTAGVPTVGARRCGGGLAGRPFVTNVSEAATNALQTSPGLVLLEGSGASLPTVPWDTGVLVLPSSISPAGLAGSLPPVRLLLSDLAVITMLDGPGTRAQDLPDLESHVRRLHPRIRIAVAELLPVPLADVRDKDAFFATTASEGPAVRLAEYLDRTSGCRIVSVSSHLGDRELLERDLERAPAFDVLLTELKAAAVDVAARRALERGAEVVFVDNRPRAAGGDGDVDELLLEAAEEARARAEARGAEADVG